VSLGILTFSGMCDVCLLVPGAAADKKFLVQPESRIAVASVTFIINEGVQSKVNTN
jgi:hypothetical protein